MPIGVPDPPVIVKLIRPYGKRTVGKLVNVFVIRSPSSRAVFTGYVVKFFNNGESKAKPIEDVVFGLEDIESMT